jgi:hypothetical protein
MDGGGVVAVMMAQISDGTTKWVRFSISVQGPLQTKFMRPLALFRYDPFSR